MSTRKNNKVAWLISCAAAVAAAAGTAVVVHDTEDTCARSSLPAEAHKQIDDILTGAKPDDGPADGKHFGNYEGLLPKKDSNYYSEYTVKTPGLNHRGARRIVVGGGTKTDPDVWYYTDDHFKSFCKISHAEG